MLVRISNYCHSSSTQLRGKHLFTCCSSILSPTTFSFIPKFLKLFLLYYRIFCLKCLDITPLDPLCICVLFIFRFIKSMSAIYINSWSYSWKIRRARMWANRTFDVRLYNVPRTGQVEDWELYFNSWLLFGSATFSEGHWWMCTCCRNQKANSNQLQNDIVIWYFYSL